MTEIIPPLPFVWDGEAMVPKMARMADRHYVVGEVYRLVPHEEVSARSRGHYFASLRDAWENLPEHMAEFLPNVAALRKYALIKAGFCDVRSLPCSSKAEAERVRDFVKPRDGFSIVTVEGSTVFEYTARSQSARAMGKDEFQRSKTAVLEIVSAMIGVERKTLAQNAGKAA